MIKWIIIVLIGLVIKCQYNLWYGQGSIPDIFRLEQTITDQTKEIAKLKDRNVVLEKEVQALKEEPQALEERARAELGMVKENESFCIIVEPDR